MGRRDHRRAGVLIALSFVLCGTAHAEDADRARDMFRRGVDLMGEERFQEAAEAFRASYDASPRVATMCNLALAYDRWGAYPDVAADAYERCAREDTSGRYAEHASTRARELRTEIEARTDPAPAPPPEQQLPPDTFVQQPPVVELQPQPIVPPPGPVPGPAPSERGHGLLYAGIGVGVLSVGAIVAAAALASSANGDAEELRRRYPDGLIPSSDRDSVDLLDGAEGKSAWSTVLYVIGGATLALSATLIVLDLTGPDTESQATLAIVPTGDGALVATQGSF